MFEAKRHVFSVIRNWRIFPTPTIGIYLNEGAPARTLSGVHLQTGTKRCAVSVTDEAEVTSPKPLAEMDITKTNEIKIFAVACSVCTEAHHCKIVNRKKL